MACANGRLQNSARRGFLYSVNGGEIKQRAEAGEGSVRPSLATQSDGQMGERLSSIPLPEPESGVASVKVVYEAGRVILA